MSHKSINREAEAALTYSDLTYLLHYDLLTGIFTWKVQMSATALAGNIAGSPHPKFGHIGIQINTKRYLAHRLAWFYVYKVWPIGVIDHKDHLSKVAWFCFTQMELERLEFLNQSVSNDSAN